MIIVQNLPPRLPDEVRIVEVVWEDGRTSDPDDIIEGELTEMPIKIGNMLIK